MRERYNRRIGLLLKKLIKHSINTILITKELNDDDEGKGVDLISKYL